MEYKILYENDITKLFYVKANTLAIQAARIMVSTNKIPREFKGIIENPTDYLNNIEIFEEDLDKTQSYVKRILSYFHGDIGEGGWDAYVFTNIPRALAYSIWFAIRAVPGNHVQGVGTEKSLRYTLAKKEIFGKNDLAKLQKELFSVYEELIEKGIEKQDARYVLSLATPTDMILQIPPGREVDKLANHLIYNLDYLTLAKEIGEKIKQHNKTFYDSPEPEIPLSKISLFGNFQNYNNFVSVDENFNVKYGANLSIVANHQNIRHRQMKIVDIEPWESIIQNKDYYMPSSIEKNEKAKEIFLEGIELAFNKAQSFWNIGDYENALYALPLAAKQHGIFYLDKDALVHVLLLRMCFAAQDEIRRYYTWLKAKYVGSLFEEEKNKIKLGPRCIARQACYEPKYVQDSCPIFNSIGHKLRTNR